MATRSTSAIRTWGKLPELRRFALLASGLCLTSAAAAAEPVSSDTNQDIVVTATRHPEHSSRIPISIVAKDRPALDQDRIETFSDLARSMPGLAERGAFGGTSKIAIRGIASNIGAATTGVYIDDTPVQVRTLGAAGVFDNPYPEIFDLERVEVLRGPQGTLFGEGSEGGTIRFITPDPDMNAIDGYGKASLATTESGAPSSLIGQAVSVPLINDVAALRLSGSDRRDGGWIDRDPYAGVGVRDHNANRRDVATGRAALRVAIGPNVFVQPSIFYQREHRSDTNQYWESLSAPAQDHYVSGQPLAQPMTDRFLVPALKIEADLGVAKFVSDTSWFDRRNAFTVDYTTHLIEGLTKGALSQLPGTPQYAVPANFHVRQHSFVEEMRLQSVDSHRQVSWTLGLHYANERQGVGQAIVDPLFGTFTRTIFGCTPIQCFGEDVLPNDIIYRASDRSRDRRIAGFASIDWRFAKRLTLTTGARVEHTISDFANMQDGPFNFGPTGGTSRVAQTQFTPRAALRYELPDGGIVYSSASRGARPGGGNTGIPAAFCAGDLAALGVSLPDGYKGDNVWTYEVGAKQRRGHATVSASAFTTVWKGIQQSIALPNCGFGFTTNLGSAVSRGFDLQFDGYLTRRLNVTALTRLRRRAL